MYDNEEEKGLDEFEGEGEGEDIRYIPLPFVARPQKESNRSTNMSKRIRSLNYLVYIPKIGSSYNCLVCVRVSRQRVFQSLKKKNILAAYKNF